MSNEAHATKAVLLGPEHALNRLQRGALLAGIIALAVCAGGGLASPTQFFRSYLVAYMFFFGIGMGCMAILMIHHITGGAWGAGIRRLLESGTRTLPLMLVLFLPLVLGMHQLYEWTHPDIVARDPALLHKAAYLNIPFFLVRAAFYFCVWLLLMRYLNRWSLEQDGTLDPAPARRLELLSRGGLLLIGLTMSFAAIDWLMSLEPHWFSTIYGILVMGGQVLSAMAFVIPLAALLAEEEGGPLAHVISKEQFHDLGKLLLAFVMLWTYFALSQFLIIWAANLPEEIPWYLKRLQGGWQWLGIAVILGHFVLPFLLLLSRDIKRRAGALAVVAVLVIVARFVDLYWMVTPAFYPKGITVHWMDALTAVGVGGVWLWFFVWQLKGRSLVAIHDPSLPEHV
ncbi:MAG TPA: hypothetical protein VMW56_07740 [Candidatus Margulisiibacteriota bacterium]|nr:hypothetical protein [Candidatus Margulisiibacteriota bacterium]